MKLFGGYEILEELGRGGMGVVYKVRDVNTDRLLALKVLSPHLCQDATYVRRFEREARMAGKLSHPNIIAVYAAGEHEGTHFIVMEYVKGQTLTDLVRQRGQLDSAEALELVRQAAEGLAYAHSLGVIHRDIKPQNIMLDETGRVRVMDLGLARLASSSSALTAEGTMLGTPLYMSPEQCRALELTPSTDIYSLGVTLYELLAGVPPYSPDTPPISLMFKITHESLPSLRMLNPGLSPHVLRLVGSMTAKSPANRPADGAHLLRQLSPFQRDEAAVPSSLPDAAPRSWAVPVAIISTLLAAVVVGIAARSGVPRQEGTDAPATGSEATAQESSRQARIDPATRELLLKLKEAKEQQEAEAERIRQEEARRKAEEAARSAEQRAQSHTPQPSQSENPSLRPLFASPPGMTRPGVGAPGAQTVPVFGQSTATRRDGAGSLYQTVSVDMNGQALGKVLEFLAGYAGVNIVCDQSLSSYVVKVNLKDVPLWQAIDSLATQAGGHVEMRGTVVHVLPGQQ